MDNTVTDGDRVDLLGPSQPGAGGLQRRRNILHVLRRVDLVDQLSLFGTFSAQARAYSDPIDLSLDQSPRLKGAVDREDLEFNARRARIDDKDRVHLRSRCWQHSFKA